MIINDKLNITPQDVWSVLIVTAATALCAVIDILLRKGDHEDSES